MQLMQRPLSDLMPARGQESEEVFSFCSAFIRFRSSCYQHKGRVQKDQDRLRAFLVLSANKTYGI